MRYWRRTSNYPERIALSNLTPMMSITDLIDIGLETLIICIFDLKINDFLLLLKHRSSHHSSCYHVFINFLHIS